MHGVNYIENRKEKNVHIYLLIWECEIGSPTAVISIIGNSHDSNFYQSGNRAIVLVG